MWVITKDDLSRSKVDSCVSSQRMTCLEVWLAYVGHHKGLLV